MISTFNLDKLNALLKDFYMLTQIRITVFDDTFHELASYPETIAPICQYIRTDPKAHTQCKSCDEQACQIASRRHSPYTYQCHAGLTESIAPLYMGNIVIGYLLFGHVFSYESHEKGFARILSQCRNYQLNPEILKEHCYKQPLISVDYINSASHILQAVASFLCLERMAILNQQELPVQIDDYIMKHYTEDMDASVLCAHFKIGKTYLYKIAKQNYGTGIAERIRFLRIEKAKSLLLEHPKMPIAEIAAQCGYDDYNYFITVFKRQTGMPPKKFITSLRK